jgi:transketolase
MSINLKAKLAADLFSVDVARKSCRTALGEALVELGEQDASIVVLTADLAASTSVDKFAAKWPERFFDVGVAEQNLVSVASGLAAAGKTPFVTGFAVFVPGRCWEQIRTTIAYNDQPVKIVATHAGLTVGPDGGTHQALEDMALMRVLPNMEVYAPCDAVETKKAVKEASKSKKPCYMRIPRLEVPVITTEDTPFQYGPAQLCWEGEDAAIIVCGPMLYEALLAAQELENQGIKCSVLNNACVKPMNVDAIVSAARRCGAVVTVEDHQISGGMGSAVAEILAERYPVPVKFIGVRDRFGESGEARELMRAYGMNKEAIKKTVLEVIEMKK